MPANLPPPYFEAEKRYREAKTAEDKIEALEEMLTIMPKHKGTDKLRADLRKRIAKHKSDAQQKKVSAKGVTAYSIEREGAAQVIIVGVRQCWEILYRGRVDKRQTRGRGLSPYHLEAHSGNGQL